MSMILAATHDKYKVRELGASEVNPAEAAGGGGEVVDAEYEADTLPLSPEAGQDVGNLVRQFEASQSPEESAS